MKSSVNKPKALKKVVITQRQGFRGGIPFTLSGQEFEPMTEKEQRRFTNGEFEPEAISEFVSIEVRVPPLNFMILKNHGYLLNKITANMDAASFEAMIDMVLLALSRNYKGIPRWLVEQSIDFGTLPALTRAFMDASGLIEREIADTMPGEKKA